IIRASWPPPMTPTVGPAGGVGLTRSFTRPSLANRDAGPSIRYDLVCPWNAPVPAAAARRGRNALRPPSAPSQVCYDRLSEGIPSGETATLVHVLLPECQAGTHGGIG